VVRIYGGPEAVEAARGKLSASIESILTAQQVASFCILPRKRKDLLSAWRSLKSDVSENLTNLVVERQSVRVTGSPDAVEAARAWLAAKGFLSLSKAGQQAPAQAGAALCLVCYCEEEEPYHYRACGHGGCTACLSAQFSQAELRADVSVPVQCFSAECSRCLLALSDINALAPPTACAVVKEACVAKYVRENQRRVAYCPAACGQLVNLEGVPRPESEADEVKYGGTVCFCEECNCKVSDT
jgi:hypothetical protein